MAQPRKHHYLPQFYLRGFSVNGRSVYQMEKEGSRAFLCSIGDAAAVRDYHLIDDAEVPDVHQVEKALGEMESRIAPALSEIHAMGLRSANSRALLIQFISLMRWRVPAAKGYFSGHLASMVKESGKLLERQGKLPPPPKGYEEILKMENIQVEISNAEPLRRMFRLATDPAMLNLLNAMRLSLLRAPFGAAFLTSDQPVALYFPDPELPRGQGIGIADPRVEISFPLSSRLLARLDWSRERAEDREVGSEVVDEFNRRTVVMASRLVFSAQESESAREMVAQLTHCSAGGGLETRSGPEGALFLSTFRPVLPAVAYSRV
jgi:hypothetical protein